MRTVSTSPYLAASSAASGDYKHFSAVPERFRTTSDPIPGQSAVPQEFRGTSNPEIARMTFTEVAPNDGKQSAERDSEEQGALADDGA